MLNTTQSIKQAVDLGIGLEELQARRGLLDDGDLKAGDSACKLSITVVDTNYVDEITDNRA
jgi:hypothetical protein